MYPHPAPICEWDNNAEQEMLEGPSGAMLDFNTRMLLCEGKTNVLNPSFIGWRRVEVLV